MQSLTLGQCALAALTVCAAVSMPAPVTAQLFGEADIGLPRGISSDAQGQTFLFGAKAKKAGRGK